MMDGRKLVYDVQKLRGGYRVYGENGTREYPAKRPSSAVKAYITQARIEEFVCVFKRKEKRHDL